MVYKALIRKRKIEQQEQIFSEIKNDLKVLIRNLKTEQQEQGFSEINIVLQNTNQKA